MEIAVVILNFNGRAYLQQFLPGVIKYSKGCRIIVADNCSTDDSVSYLRNDFADVELICLEKNSGFSEGYNQVLKQLTGLDYCILLNSDVEVTPNWIEPVIEVMQKDPNIVAAQPKILDFHRKAQFEYAGGGGGFIDSLGYPFCRGRIFLQLEKDTGQYDDDIDIFWATGACMFIRHDTFIELGGFDPDFFAHMEEIDLCWRIHNAGYRVVYTGQSKVYHVGGGTLPKSNPFKTYLNFRNGFSLLYKNCTRWELWKKLPIRIFLDIIASIKFFFFDSPADGFAVIRAHFDFWKRLPSNIKKRKATLKFRKEKSINVIYSGSIVWDHFVRKIKKFSELKARFQ